MKHPLHLDYGNATYSKEELDDIIQKAFDADDRDLSYIQIGTNQARLMDKWPEVTRKVVDSSIKPVYISPFGEHWLSIISAKFRDELTNEGEQE